MVVVIILLRCYLEDSLVFEKACYVVKIFSKAWSFLRSRYLGMLSLERHKTVTSAYPSMVLWVYDREWYTCIYLRGGRKRHEEACDICKRAGPACTVPHPRFWRTPPCYSHSFVFPNGKSICNILYHYRLIRRYYQISRLVWMTQA